MNRLIFCFAVVVVAGIVTSCSSTPETKTDPMKAAWHVVSMGAKELSGMDASIVPTLAFDPVKMTVGGSAGCNNYNGSYNNDINGMSFSAIAVTKKMCQEEAMSIETQFLEALNKTAKMKVDDDELTLLDAAGVELLKAKAHE